MDSIQIDPFSLGSMFYVLCTIYYSPIVVTTPSRIRIEIDVSRVMHGGDTFGTLVISLIFSFAE